VVYVGKDFQVVTVSVMFNNILLLIIIIFMVYVVVNHWRDK